MNFANLLKHGYKEFTPSHKNNVLKSCQKRIMDQQGNTLYYITIHLYNRYGEDKYEAEIQLYQNETHLPLNLTFFDGWKLSDIELYAELIYYVGILSHFEPYDTGSQD